LSALGFQFFLTAVPGAAMTVGNLACDHRANPLGIDLPQPYLSWVLQSSQRGDGQSAYQVLVASSQALLDENKGDLWDSAGVRFSAARRKSCPPNFITPKSDKERETKVWASRPNQHASRVRYHSYFGVRVQRPAEALAAFVPFAVSRLLFVANQPVRPDVRDLDFQLVSLRFHGAGDVHPPRRRPDDTKIFAVPVRDASAAIGIAAVNLEVVGRRKRHDKIYLTRN
jgi:hypothetical protein